MANYTTNYNLTKPTASETASISPINNNMDIIDDIMHGSQISLAPAYNSTLTYTLKDLVMYDYEMYRCIEAISIPEAFDPNKWTRTTLAEEVINRIAEITPQNGGE